MFLSLDNLDDENIEGKLVSVSYVMDKVINERETRATVKICQWEKKDICIRQQPTPYESILMNRLETKWMFRISSWKMDIFEFKCSACFNFT